MRRLLSALRWDATVQFRSGFYYVGAFVVVFFVGLLSFLPDYVELNLGLIVPGLLVINLMITTFYFIAALVLMEKNEGTLAALVTSPLRDTEYLASKVVSLTFLAVAENLLMVIIAFGADFDGLRLIVGAILLCVFYVTVGFVVIAQYDSINEYLIPSGLVVSLLILPLLDHFRLYESRLFYLHPIQPSLVVMRSAFESVEGWQLGYGIIGSLFWGTVSFLAAQAIFHRFVVRAAGGSFGARA